MRKVISFLLLFVFAGSILQAQLLYKISGNGLSKPSYVIGTYHLAPISFADSIPGLHDALAACNQVYGELDMSVLTDTNKLMELQQAMLLPQGQKLSSLFTDDQLVRLNATLRELLGVDLSNPMVASQLEMLTPQALSQQLSVLLFMKRKPGFDPQNLFDAYFQKEAAALNKPVGGLETVEFQKEVLFLSTPLPRAVEQLMCFVDNLDYQYEMADKIISAYFTQDLNAVNTVIEEKRHDSCDATPEEEERLIFGRNATWAEKLPAIMQEKSTFLAVGAAHLPGERGLLALLRKAGYTVDAVK